MYASVRVRKDCCMGGHQMQMGDIDKSYFASTFSERHEELKDWSYHDLPFLDKLFIFTFPFFFIFIFLLLPPKL